MSTTVPYLVMKLAIELKDYIELRKDVIPLDSTIIFPSDNHLSDFTFRTNREVSEENYKYILKDFKSAVKCRFAGGTYVYWGVYPEVIIDKTSKFLYTIYARFLITFEEPEYEQKKQNASPAPSAAT